VTAIRVAGLRKSYGDVEAVRDVGFEVADGETVAVLGPNGAGKTTTVEILIGLRRRDAGAVEVLGADPETAGRPFREQIGVVLQTCEPEPYLSAREQLDLYAGWYRAPRPTDELLELVGLTHRADARCRSLSGGERRRLDLALALVGGPRLLFLDEPTTGFDPDARRTAWSVVGGLRAAGTTVVLTTHYLDEAEALADRVVVIAGGRVVADAPPADIGARRARVEIRFTAPTDVPPGDAPLPVEVRGTHWVVETREPTRALHALTGWALDRGTDLGDLDVHRPTLEDAYLEVVQ
jgi:ABC-2 type transport system ATP-binding protein